MCSALRGKGGYRVACTAKSLQDWRRRLWPRNCRLAHCEGSSLMCAAICRLSLAGSLLLSPLSPCRRERLIRSASALRSAMMASTWPGQIIRYADQHNAHSSMPAERTGSRRPAPTWYVAPAWPPPLPRPSPAAAAAASPAAGSAAAARATTPACAPAAPPPPAPETRTGGAAARRGRPRGAAC